MIDPPLSASARECLLLKRMDGSWVAFLRLWRQIGSYFEKGLFSGSWAEMKAAMKRKFWIAVRKDVAVTLEEIQAKEGGGGLESLGNPGANTSCSPVRRRGTQSSSNGGNCSCEN